VKAEVDRMFAEAEAALKNPSIAAYRAVEEWRQQRAARPADDDDEDALDLHLTTLLGRDNLEAHQRAVLEERQRGAQLWDRRAAEGAGGEHGESEPSGPQDLR
jgi:hypothetical protein